MLETKLTNSGFMFLIIQMVEEWCLTIVGNLITPGSKLGLSLEQNEDKQYWHIHPDGRIYSKMKPELVLDIKGKHLSRYVISVARVMMGFALKCSHKFKYGFTLQTI